MSTKTGEVQNPTCVPSLEALVKAGRSLGPVVAREVLEFTATPTSSEWTAAEREKLRQGLLFDTRRPLERIPYDFHFLWRDADGAEHKSFVVAWEYLEAWRQYRRRYADPIAKLREKLLNDHCGPRRTVSFFMGNMARFRDQFLVCGVFCPPKETEVRASLWT